MKSINDTFHCDHLLSESIFKGLTHLFSSCPSLYWVYLEIWKRAMQTLSLLQMPEQKPREMKDLAPCKTYQHTSQQCGENPNVLFDLFQYRLVNNTGAR